MGQLKPANSEHSVDGSSHFSYWRLTSFGRRDGAWHAHLGSICHLHRSICSGGTTASLVSGLPFIPAFLVPTDWAIPLLRWHVISTHSTNTGLRVKVVLAESELVQVGLHLTTGRLFFSWIQEGRRSNIKSCKVSTFGSSFEFGRLALKCLLAKYLVAWIPLWRWSWLLLTERFVGDSIPDSVVTQEELTLHRLVLLLHLWSALFSWSWPNDCGGLRPLHLGGASFWRLRLLELWINQVSVLRSSLGTICQLWRHSVLLMNLSRSLPDDAELWQWLGVSFVVITLSTILLLAGRFSATVAAFLCLVLCLVGVALVVDFEFFFGTAAAKVVLNTKSFGGRHLIFTDVNSTKHARVEAPYTHLTLLQQGFCKRIWFIKLVNLLSITFCLLRLRSPQLLLLDSLGL